MHRRPVLGPRQIGSECHSWVLLVQGVLVVVVVACVRVCSIYTSLETSLDPVNEEAVLYVTGTVRVNKCESDRGGGHEDKRRNVTGKGVTHLPFAPR